MYRILARRDLAPEVHLFRIAAPRVAAVAQAGQFVIIRLDERGERIPLTIADWDAGEGSVSVVFMELGATTRRLAGLMAGDVITDLAGPLGNPSHIANFGHVVCVAGGFAIATIVPIARALEAAGNRVTAVAGARSQERLFWLDRLGQHADQLIVTTDDGSYGEPGVVTEPLRRLLEEGGIDLVVAIGPSVMMKYCSATTKPFGVKTIVSLNPIMIDGTGMCGCCRVAIGGQTRFACVDGPEFDGHLVDWDLLISRQRAYLNEEATAVSHLGCPDCGHKREGHG